MSPKDIHLSCLCVFVDLWSVPKVKHSGFFITLGPTMRLKPFLSQTWKTGIAKLLKRRLFVIQTYVSVLALVRLDRTFAKKSHNAQGILCTWFTREGGDLQGNDYSRQVRHFLNYLICLVAFLPFASAAFILL